MNKKLQLPAMFIYTARIILISVITGFFKTYSADSQTEVMAWGNLNGIRVEGQLMEFQTNISVIGNGWKNINETGREKQRPKYHRVGDTQIVTTGMKGFKFNESVKENGTGSAIISIKSKALTDTTVEGVFFCINISDKLYNGGTLKLQPGKLLKLAGIKEPVDSVKKAIQKFEVRAGNNAITLSSGNEVCFFYRKDENAGLYKFYLRLMGPSVKKGDSTQLSLTVNASGPVDTTAAEITIDAQHPGWRFAGFGGNFRLQNPINDPPVIQYCLDNLRVAWGRVEMPWSSWQPKEDINPISEAKAGKLNEHVHQSMLMAQRLAQKGIPIIISDWSAPAWAIIGDPADAWRNRSKGIYGYQLNSAKLDKIYQSIGDYLEYLKQNYGVEPALFSFNESDLGINIRHTGKEHDEFIKGLGAHLASRGIVTKMLLGDNSDATTFDFILPALRDPESHKYIGAVSFHSWRGCTDTTLKKWAGAARELNLPLIVAEGSTDASAHMYSEIFYEQTFALYEINLYMRLCSICQPLAILQWQLTSDYSILSGNGIYGTQGPLSPTRRFWNLKQLASTPADAFSLPFSCTNLSVNCAAFGNIARGEYCLHMVNNGARRKALIRGLPDGVTKLEVFVTDQTKGMVKTREVNVINGTAEVELLPTSFTSLFGVRA